MAKLDEKYRTKMKEGTTDRCRIHTEHDHPLGHVEINWLEDGGCRIRFPKSPDLYLKRAYLDGGGRTPCAGSGARPGVLMPPRSTDA